MTRRWLMAVMVAGLLVRGSAAAQPAVQGPIKIGIVGPFSGRGAEAGERVASAVKMAVEEFNAAGGVGGVKVDIVIGDDEGVPEKSTLVAQRMADDAAMLGGIGPMNSGAVLAAGTIYERAGLPFITPTATNARVTEQGWKMAHRLAGRDDREGPASAIFIAEEIKPKKVLLISDKTAFQAGIVQEVQRVLQQRGIADTDLEAGRDQERGLSPPVPPGKASGANLLYLGMTAPQAALFVRQAAQGGLKVRGLGNGSLREREAFVKAAGGDAEGIFVSYNAQDPRMVPEAKDFIAKFQAKYNKSVSAYDPQAYDGTMILLNAIKTAAAKGGRVNRDDVAAAITAVKGYRGVLGLPIHFDGKGDIAAAP